jgi:subtilisin family serine protease
VYALERDRTTGPIQTADLNGFPSPLQFGVAKDATLVSVKVLDRYGNGNLAGVVAGVEYVAKTKASNSNKPMVASTLFRPVCLIRLLFPT